MNPGQDIMFPMRQCQFHQESPSTSTKTLSSFLDVVFSGVFCYEIRRVGCRVPSSKHTKNYGKSPWFNGQINCKWPFSIAMLVYQRVYCTLTMCSLSLSLFLALALQVLLNSVATDKQSIPRHLLWKSEIPKKTQKRMRIIRHIQTLLSYHLSCSQNWGCQSSGLSLCQRTWWNMLSWQLSSVQNPKTYKGWLRNRAPHSWILMFPN